MSDTSTEEAAVATPMDWERLRSQPDEVSEPEETPAEDKEFVSRTKHRSDPRFAGMPGFTAPTPSNIEVKFANTKGVIVLPVDMTYENAQRILQQQIDVVEQPTRFSRTFSYRPDDGAYATYMVIKEMYGKLLGVGEKMMSGDEPAETRSITVAPGVQVNVPWGGMSIPGFENLTVNINHTSTLEHGRVFAIIAVGPNKYKDEMERFFDTIDTYLRENSIYRGQSIIGAESPQFLDLTNFNEDEIVFSEEVVRQVENNIWSRIKHAQSLREAGVKLSGKFLLMGPYGTGKTSLGAITAKLANAHGWTFLSGKAGHESPEDVLKTARMYAPAIVFLEDVDAAASAGDDEKVTRLLDAFDGINSKDGEVVVIMTTNHADRIHKGMLRPGRLDGMIEVAHLDEAGIEKLIRIIVPEGKLDPETDFGAVAAVMEGFYPAFVKQAIIGSVTAAITEGNGSSDYMISTAQLVNASTSLRPQLNYLEGATLGVKSASVDTALKATVTDTLTGMQGFERDTPEGFHFDFRKKPE